MLTVFPRPHFPKNLCFQKPAESTAAEVAISISKTVRHRMASGSASRYSVIHPRRNGLALVATGTRTLNQDSPEIGILDRILSWADRHDNDVMLHCMWPNVGWLAFPEYQGDPVFSQASASADLDAFTEGWVIVIDELIRMNRTSIGD